MRFQVDQPARSRDRRVVGRSLVQRNSHELADRQRVACSPRDPAFAIDAFEVPYQQQSKIDTWRQPRPPHNGGIEWLAFSLHKSVKIALRQKLIQPFIEGMTCRARQSATRNPKLLLVF